MDKSRSLDGSIVGHLFWGIGSLVAHSVALGQMIVVLSRDERKRLDYTTLYLSYETCELAGNRAVVKI